MFVPGANKLYTVPVTGAGRPELTAALTQQWQRALGLLRDTLGACTACVMQIGRGSLRVFLCCGDTGEQYAQGARWPLGTGTYCETVIGENGFLIVPIEALPVYAQDSAVPGYYCGMPLRWPDGSFFGTLCLFIGRAQLRGEAVKPLLETFASSMEKDLALLCLRQGRDGSYEKYAQAMEALLQYSPGGIFSYSAEQDEQFSFISDNMLAFLGYTKDEFLSKFDSRFSQMVYTEDRERTLREIDEQISHSPFDHCEYRIEKHDGTLAWVHDEGHIVADSQGKRWFYVVIVDITESVQAQQRERQKFRAAVQALLTANPEAVGTLQFNLTRNSCGEGHGVSDTTREMLQAATVDSFFANAAAQIPDAQQRSAFLRTFDRSALLAQFAAGRTAHSMDYVRANDGGALLWVRMYLHLLKNPDTEDVEGVVYSVDISREKRRDEILHIITSQEYDLIALLHLSEGTVEAYFLGDTLPAPFRELLPRPGAVYGLDAFRANAMARWLHPDDREKYRRCSDPAYYRPLMDERGHFEFVLRECFPTAAGESGVMYRKFQHYYLGRDRDTIVVIESDVTQTCLRQAQELEKAKAEAERVRDIMDSIATGISVLHMPDPEYLSIAYVNQQMFRLLGFAPEGDGAARLDRASEKLVTEYMADAFTGVHPDDLARVKKTFCDNYNAKHFVVDNYRTRGFGGKYYWIKEEVRLREVTPAYRVFYATYHDVSEEVRLNGELTAQLEAEKQLRREATAANAAKSEFLSRMSHDIRTPLNGIIGMAYLAREQQNPPQTADCLTKIDTSSQFLLGLINDVLDMSQAESDHIELNPEPYAASEFNSYLDAVIRPLCQEKGQQFALDEQRSRSDVVPLADKLRTNQIIFNLLSNAVKYTPEGGTITCRLRERTLPSGKLGVDYEISDTGIGMSEAFQKVLFEPFSQENRDDNSETRGSGLGLAIVKKLVDRMGGTIAVKSRVGEGTTFYVHLEYDAVPAAEVRREERSGSVHAAGAVRGRHVLLCEDHPLNQEIAKSLLERHGAIVELAANGKRGAELFAASPLGYYDVVLMDLRMPVMNGFEATRAIRALQRPDAGSVPIVAMTADAFAQDVQRCLDAGMNAHIAKPIEPQVLFDVLAGLL